MMREWMADSAIWGVSGGALVAAVIKLFSTEKPYLATIKHQNERIDTLEAQTQDLRAYVSELVGVMRLADLDVPLPPPGV